MNLLFKPESETARGTLSQLKTFFAHKSLKKQVSANFQHCWDMMEFATSAYITLLATTMCGMTTVDDVPQGLPKQPKEQLTWLTCLANQIVDFAWMPPEQDQINLVAASFASTEDSAGRQPFLYCTCKEDKEDDMVRCSSSRCKIGRVHLSCAGLTEAPEGDWYCSSDCEEDGTYIHCWCHERKGGVMVQCQMGNKCRKAEWYHTACLLPSNSPNAPDLWYCSEECKVDGSGVDYILKYTKALMWEGLSHLARRDAVGEGDGPAMVDSWKLDLLQFWRRSHPKYFRIGHHMLTGIGGYLPANLQADLTWNRVANPSGREGGNIGLDLLNECLSNDFKEMMKRSHLHTENVVKRCAEMSGSFGQDLDKLFTTAGIGVFTKSLTRGDSNKKRMIQDIKLFVREYQSDGLFTNTPGRFHEGFKNFTYDTKLKNPKKMGRKMRELAEEIDKWE